MLSKHANQNVHRCMLFVRHDRYLAGTSMQRFKSIHVAKFTLAAASSVEKKRPNRKIGLKVVTVSIQIRTKFSTNFFDI